MSKHSALLGCVPMPELRGMRAVPRAVKAQGRFPRCSSVCGCAAKWPRILLTQVLANQNTELSRFPQLKPLFHLVVPVDTLRDFSKEHATAVAARPRTGDRSRLLRDVLPKPWRIAHRGSAIADARRSSG